MNAASLTALAGIAGVLLGTLGSGVMQWLAERRRERSQARVAAGFIRAELARIQFTLQAALQSGVWCPPAFAPSFPAWQQWGPALLTGAASQGGVLHGVVVLIEGLDRSAGQAYGTLEAAERRRSHADEIGDIASEAAAFEEVKTARTGVALTEAQRQQISRAIEEVNTAVNDVPGEGRSPKKRRAIAAAVCVAAVLIITGGVVAAVIHYRDTTVTADEVANSVRAVRGAAEASCSSVHKAQNTYSCELTYVVPDPPPPAPPPCSLAHTAAALPAGRRTVASETPLLALTSRGPPACKVEVITDDNVDIDPRKLFTDAYTRVVVEGTTGAARNLLSRRWKTEHEPAVTGEVKTD